ncbi:hypothetical protein NVIE_007340 [Nitrososphaera viennensis EN76]|uniref:Uncharacterized protein n=1 Tax=Nitrososphaera viennensis EN76 TaxID=926571 RepID=A0A060HE69_9ARCH|nr:hypothetical protein NVIE_007340 [Nitrososphaera viennensis EN76]
MHLVWIACDKRQLNIDPYPELAEYWINDLWPIYMDRLPAACKEEE